MESSRCVDFFPIAAVTLGRGERYQEKWARAFRTAHVVSSSEGVPLSLQAIPGVSGRCSRELPEPRRLRVFSLRRRSMELEFPRRHREVVPPMWQLSQDVQILHWHWRIRFAGLHSLVANLPIAVALQVQSMAFPAGEVLWAVVQVTAPSVAVLQRLASRNRSSRGATSQALKHPLCQGWSL